MMAGILYTPAADYNGTDSFTYTITDLDGKMDPASVSITINPVNDTPRGGNDTATVLEPLGHYRCRGERRRG